MFIHDEIIDARVQVHGRPSPDDFDLQREWFREALRDSLELAAKTRQVSHLGEKTPPRRNNTLGPSITEHGPNTTSDMGFDIPFAPVMETNVTGWPGTFHSHTQQTAIPQQWEAARVPDEMAINAMNDQFYGTPTAQMTDNNGRPFPSHNFLEQGDQNDFDISEWVIRDNLEDR